MTDAEPGAVHPHGTDELPLDPEVLSGLHELEARNGEDVLGELVPVFLQQVDLRLARLERALARADGAVVAAEAHSLKGSSGIVGARRLAALFARLEGEQGVPAEPGQAADLVRLLHDELDRVREALDAELRR